VEINPELLSGADGFGRALFLHRFDATQAREKIRRNVDIQSTDETKQNGVRKAKQ